MENTFGRKPSAGLVNPDEVVALGAAAHAGALEGVATASDALGPMQASLIRAFAAKMREENRDAFERASQLCHPDEVAAMSGFNQREKNLD